MSSSSSSAESKSFDNNRNSISDGLRSSSSIGSYNSSCRRSSSLGLSLNLRVGVVATMSLAMTCLINHRRRCRFRDTAHLQAHHSGGAGSASALIAVPDQQSR